MDLSVCHVNLAKGFRGGERQTALLIEYLEQHTSKQYLVCRKDSPLIEKLQNIKNLEIITIKGRFSGHVKKINADIIQAHEAKAVHWACIEYFLHKTPYVFTRRVPQQIKNTFLSKLCYSKAKYGVGISSIITNYLLKLNLTHTITIPDALTKHTFNQDSSNDIKQNYLDKFIIGHIGAYVDKHKGQSLIIEVARRLQHENLTGTFKNNIIFLLLGSGKDQEYFINNSKDLSNIKFLGFHNNIGDYLNIFDVFVFPSRNEGLGSTLLDALDFEIPIIASNVDGIPDIIKNNETGVLFENNDIDEFYDKIKELYENENQRKVLAQKGKAYVKNFLPEKIALRYLDLYQTILKNR